ncbi:hypothetical protein BRADI_3g33626v3 [Brachypodium distachyon]|uniref:Uncharacterized protein n=1 Tax=Brachypodium distachyon TaxID=15368 RepID=A0A2K2D0W1_BRADI|nr:hypothetical protein BRADI_3g33626v3 [Brachypodium distachyon]
MYSYVHTRKMDDQSNLLPSVLLPGGDLVDGRGFLGQLASANHIDRTPGSGFPSSRDPRRGCKWREQEPEAAAEANPSSPCFFLDVAAPRLLPRPQGHSSRSSRPAQPPAAIVGKRLQAPPRAAHRCRPTTPAATPSRRRHAPDPPHHHAVACARDSAPRIWLHAREGQGTRENRGMGIPGGDGIGRNQFGGGRDGGSTVGCWRSGRIGRKSGEGEGDQGVGPSGDGEGASILHVPGAAP